jgi:uncharacterized protein (DUF1501 family)
MACHCKDFERTVAAAGRGLPAIEPGMPAPAGSGLSRRSFLARGLGGALAVYGASKLPLAAFEEGIANAAGRSDRILISIFLPGGVDALSVLAPVGDARYATLRPTLALAAGSGTAFREDARLMWAPQLAGLAALHAEGKVTVLPGVGMDSPDQSHFTSRHFWEVGATDVGGRFGWMGRYLDLHGAPDNPLQGLALDYALAPSLAAASVPVAAVPEPDDFSLSAWAVGDPVLSPMLQTIGRLGALPTDDPGRRSARLVAGHVDHLRAQLDGFALGTSPVTYPSGSFARRLRAIPAMLAAGLPLRCVALEAPGGFDTHASQAASLPADLTRVDSAVLALQRDLEARGLADRVLIHVWSEFGRRAAENEGGTDHGAAGVGFLVGTRASGRQVGEFPGLTSLDSGGNLRATSDFRAVYRGLLEQWFGVDAAPIIPGAERFAPPVLVR